MGRKHIYFADPILEALKEHPEVNVSAVCSAALIKAMDPEISTEALITTVEHGVAEAAETILHPPAYRVSFAKTTALTLSVQSLAEAGAEIIAISHDGEDHCIVWRQTV